MLRACLLFCCVTGLSATDFCKPKPKLIQNLLNEGFHREGLNGEKICKYCEEDKKQNITYNIDYDTDSILDYHMNGNCFIGLGQALPQGVYANPDELEDFGRLEKLQALAKSRVNIELPAEESQPTGVFIFAEVNDNTSSAWLPVHARYHHAALGGGFVKNEIPAPIFYMRCLHVKLEECAFSNTVKYYCDAYSKELCNWTHIPLYTVTETLQFEVPIGNTSHYYIVSAMTAAVVIAGSLYFLKTLHEYKIKEKAL